MGGVFALESEGTGQFSVVCAAARELDRRHCLASDEVCAVVSCASPQGTWLSIRAGVLAWNTQRTDALPSFMLRRTRMTHARTHAHRYCDDGTYGLDFNCTAYSFDSGDCGWGGCEVRCEGDVYRESGWGGACTPCLAAAAPAFRTRTTHAYQWKEYARKYTTAHAVANGHTYAHPHSSRTA